MMYDLQIPVFADSIFIFIDRSSLQLYTSSPSACPWLLWYQIRTNLLCLADRSVPCAYGRASGCVCATPFLLSDPDNLHDSWFSFLCDIAHMFFTTALSYASSPLQILCILPAYSLCCVLLRKFFPKIYVAHPAKSIFFKNVFSCHFLTASSFSSLCICGFDILTMIFP